MNNTDSIAERAIKAIREAEQLRQAAINDLTKQREDIDKKLAELEQTAAGQATNDGKTKGQRKNPCKVCGSEEHDGRFHRRSSILASSSKEKPIPQNQEVPIRSAQP